MCSLPLNQLFKKVGTTDIKKKDTKTFLATAGQRSWQPEVIYAREPVRQLYRQ